MNFCVTGVSSISISHFCLNRKYSMITGAASGKREEFFDSRALIAGCEPAFDVAVRRSGVVLDHDLLVRGKAFGTRALLKRCVRIGERFAGRAIVLGTEGRKRMHDFPRGGRELEVIAVGEEVV